MSNSSKHVQLKYFFFKLYREKKKGINSEIDKNIESAIRRRGQQTTAFVNTL